MQLFRVRVRPIPRFVSLSSQFLRIRVGIDELIGFQLDSLSSWTPPSSSSSSSSSVAASAAAPSLPARILASASSTSASTSAAAGFVGSLTESQCKSLVDHLLVPLLLRPLFVRGHAGTPNRGRTETMARTCTKAFIVTKHLTWRVDISGVNCHG